MFLKSRFKIKPINSSVHLTLKLRIGATCSLMSSPVNYNTTFAEVCRHMDLYPLKPKQLEALGTFISGKDNFVALPTGYGKSIIFALVPMLSDVTFSPFI